jgi:hypothetical protein
MNNLTSRIVKLEAREAVKTHSIVFVDDLSDNDSPKETINQKPGYVRPEIPIYPLS